MKFRCVVEAKSLGHGEIERAAGLLRTGTSHIATSVTVIPERLLLAEIFGPPSPAACMMFSSCPVLQVFPFIVVDRR